MLLNIECNYCGNEWNLKVYNQRQAEDQICDKCDDSNLTIKEANTVDYYQGCPPFPANKAEQEADSWGLYNMENNGGNLDD